MDILRIIVMAPLIAFCIMVVLGLVITTIVLIINAVYDTFGDLSGTILVFFLALTIIVGILMTISQNW